MSETPGISTIHTITTEDTSASGKPRFQIDPPEGSRVDTVSQDMCHRETWYQKSEAVVGEALSDSGDGLTFHSTHDNWIDVYHGKLTGEHYLRSMYGHKVYVDSVQKTESSPGMADGDFQVDFETGDVTFNSSQSGNTVTADYHYENGSRWIIKPTEGKKLILTAVEVQFSTNVTMMDSIVFEIWVGGNKVQDAFYQTFQDLINASVGSYPQVPALGGNNWRGNQFPVNLLRWPYYERGVTIMKSSQLWEAHVRLENNNAFMGEHVVTTFYGISENE